MLQVALNVINYLNGKGVKAYIAGGYPRDLYFKQNPKDCDIVVPYFGPDGAELFEFCKSMCETFRITTHNVAISEAYDAVSDQNIIGVCKIDKVDVIFYCQSDLLGIIQSFDCNMNQFVGGNQNLEFLGDVHPKEQLIFLGNNFLREGRKEAMIAKWEQYTGKTYIDV